MTQTSDPARQLLRHAVATLAYRSAKALRGAPESVASFKIGESPRTPAKILAHLGDLLDWALSMAQGEMTWRDSEPLPWKAEADRFFATLKKFDDFLASSESPKAPVEKLFQGPVTHTLAHVGQFSMLRRFAGFPINGEHYFKAGL